LMEHCTAFIGFLGVPWLLGLPLAPLASNRIPSTVLHPQRRGGCADAQAGLQVPWYNARTGLQVEHRSKHQDKQVR
jgi:hypothetical protein